MPDMIRRLLEFSGGPLFVSIGGLFLHHSIQMPLGSLRSFGPGMFPFLVSVLLIIGGILQTIIDVRSIRPDATVSLAFVRPTLLLLSYVIFAVSIDVGGLALAIPATVLTSYLSFGGRSAAEVLLLTLILTAGCMIIFKLALNLPLPALPRGIGF